MKKYYLFVFLLISSFAVYAQNNDTISLHWLDNAPSVENGVSWGVPWAKGEIKKDQKFTLINRLGQNLPVQMWVNAWWPDGSVKWSGFSTIVTKSDTGILKLVKVKKEKTFSTILIQQNPTQIKIITGKITCIIPKQGENIIDTLLMDNKIIAINGHLVSILEDRSQYDNNQTLQFENFKSEIQKVTLEQNGAYRAVVKIEGKHRSLGRAILPFIVRLYFYTQTAPIRMTHTFIFDGNADKDFIKGLGIKFSVPFREEIYNRQVRFSGEGNGLWSEPVQPLRGRDRRFVSYPDSGDVYIDQIAGLRIPNPKQLDRMSNHLIKTWAVWNDFKLVQPNPDGFSLEKRTNNKSSWLTIGSGWGSRSSGLVFVGDVSGGIAIGVKNFWKSYPASLEINNAAMPTADITAWLWSPDAAAMDLRHYDTIAHGLDEVYEDVQPGFSTPEGIARTSELTIFPCSSMPSKSETVDIAGNSNKPPILVCTPQYYHKVKAFGIWSLPDTSTQFKLSIEKNLSSTLNYYKQSVEQHHWYGFWNYGDVMHSYDDVRHEWRYDLGGMAWDNTELGTDMWLWYSFLRTGEAEIYRMAEAMTRHTSEVDCYHSGRFAGLGSRHNVSHWGCGAKEARISQAAYRRFYYYLSTDERTGDIMHEVADADFKAVEYDPMRLAQPITENEKKFPGRVRFGPDWLAFVGNWMTEWERTGNVNYRNKIITGIDCISKMKYGIKTGTNLVMGYDPKTGELFALNDQVSDYNLATIMGGAEVIFELNNFLENDNWMKLWLQYCRLTEAPGEVILKDKATNSEGPDASFARADRLSAYVYLKTANKAFAKRAYERIGGRQGNNTLKYITGPEVINPIYEQPRIGTNGAAQSSLVAIEVLEMCADQLPDSVPKFNNPNYPRFNPNQFQRRRNIENMDNKQETKTTAPLQKKN